MRFVCASDTHGMHEQMQVPAGDVFIHAGDFTDLGEGDDIVLFNEFLGTLPHKHKIVIAGNHEGTFEWHPKESRRLLTNCIYLEDSEVSINGIRIYGSPWTPSFHEMAFCLPKGRFIREKWDLIPAGIDVLVTHGPPAGHGDRKLGNLLDEGQGCFDLLAAVQRIRPKYHVFGHIHRGYGLTWGEHTTYINAAIFDEEYQPTHPPMLFDL